MKIMNHAASTLCRGGILLINGWILRVCKKSSSEVVVNLFNQNNYLFSYEKI